MKTSRGDQPPGVDDPVQFYGTVDARVSIYTYELNSMRASLCALSYTWDHELFTDIVIAKAKQGIRVRIVADGRQLEESCEGRNSAWQPTRFFEMINSGVEVRLMYLKGSKYARQHSKTIIIDDATVLTGSCNLTTSGFTETGNHEHAVRIRLSLIHI